MQKGQLKVGSKNWIMSKTDEIPLPKDFDTWLDKVVFTNNSKMFITHIGPKKYFGNCQHCKKIGIELFGIKAGQKGKCANCGAVVTFRKESASHVVDDVGFVSYLCKIDTGFVVRNFKVHRMTDYLDYRFITSEMERCYIDDTLTKKQWFQFRDRWDNEEQIYKTNWIKGFYQNMRYSLPKRMCLYPNNLKKVFKGTKLQYSGIPELAKQSQVNTPDYMFMYPSRPQLEYLVKLKLTKLVNSVVDNDSWSDYLRYTGCLNFNSNNVKEILKLSGKYYDYALKYNPKCSELVALQVLQSQNLTVKKQNVDYLVLWNVRKLDDIMKYLSLESLIEYCKSQKLKDESYFYNDYLDYIKACEKLKYNLNDTMYLKPRNFKEMHDKVLKQLEEYEDKQKNAKIRRKFKQFLKFAFECKDFKIIPPKSATDLINEGKALSHCVGTYVDRVAEGKSIVLFIRQTADENKSFYTVEINPKDLTIVQCRGSHNKSATKDVNEFINKWYKKVIEPMRKTA